ncbi:MAG: CoA transferase [Acidimicrobiia bacterium]|jgi:crotonobetainyl-CoA:carnitine CoA-transferase CaiB-like acyl-CoA transferase
MGALDGLRVVDMATLIAAPGAARYLADFGAEVIKVEAPGGDGSRNYGWPDPRDGEALFWKQIGRNKRAVVLDLKTASGLDAMRGLLDRSDVLVENLRPGTLERLGLDPADLLARNPGLVILRVSGFGQDGPYAMRPGFATLAEAMGGFAALNGEPDGAPLLPPVALTDEVTALVGAFAVMVALHHRDRTGEGQVIDVNLLESMIAMIGPLPAVWAQRGELQPRLGSGIPYSVPRGTFRCADGVWVAVSASAESIAQRVLALVGVADDPRFGDFDGRVHHRRELDELVGAWIGARPSEDVLRAFTEAQAAIAPVYTMQDLLADEHVQARGTFVDVDGVTMPGPVARLGRSPGEVRHAGRPLGADTDAVLREVLAEPPRAAPGGGGSDATRPEEGSA